MKTGMEQTGNSNPDLQETTYRRHGELVGGTVMVLKKC